MRRLLFVASLAVSFAAHADEGMWTFNNFPSQKVKAKYGFEPTKQWLEHVQLSSARLATGCSASFVSAEGLVLTNHHCARGCIQQLSTAKEDLIKNGFLAKTHAEERKCPAMEVNKLLEITDVTARVQGATKGLVGEKFQSAQKAELSKIEKECQSGLELRCDVISLYQGGLFHLHRYARFQDVRLAFAPEHQIAFFGGDPDNFEFPRYDLDMAFFRVYQNDKPAKIDHFFKWSEKGAQKGELTFISGNPGKTSRLDTIAKLEYARDHALPERLLYLAELRGLVTEFQKRGAEQTRISNNIRFGVENALKALRGRREALVDQKLFAQKVKEEKALWAKVMGSAKRKKAYGNAWKEIATAVAKEKELARELYILEAFAGSGSELFWIARTLHRSGEELPKPNEERLREFSEAKLPPLKQKLFSAAPVYPELESALLSYYLVKLREMLGPDHPAVKQVLGKDAPEALAAKVATGSKLIDPAVRKQLFEGGAAALSASKDPMLGLIRSLDSHARAVRKQYEDEVESVYKRNEELIARARFEVYGTKLYPDATFSARLSFGAVEGYTEEGKVIEPITLLGGTFERATGEDPFALPPSWLAAKPKLNLQTPMNFASTNDIIGGNSGSPVVNKEAEIVGLVFDGNIQSLGGEYGFDAAQNRAVSVHSAAMIEALEKIYAAPHLVRELRPQGGAAGTTGAP